MKEGDHLKLKDKKIELLIPVNVINANGYPEETLKAICPPVWAYFRHLSGKERYSADAINAIEEVLFQINYRTDITTSHVIRFKGVLYDITRVDCFEGYKNDLKLYAKRRAE